MDLGQLSPAQQEALQQYTAVTDQEVEAAIPILQRSQWNVQVDYQSSSNPTNLDVRC
jgi:FAS-associated factor 2